MTAKGGPEKTGKPHTEQQSLKGALAGVLSKSPPNITPPPPVREPLPQKPSEPLPPAVPSKQPFEVPEEALRKVLRGEA
jgi:hypothetical protein